MSAATPQDNQHLAADGWKCARPGDTARVMSRARFHLWLVGNLYQPGGGIARRCRTHPHTALGVIHKEHALFIDDGVFLGGQIELAISYLVPPTSFLDDEAILRNCRVSVAHCQ
jgi:hypothetical protein